MHWLERGVVACQSNTSKIEAYRQNRKNAMHVIQMRAIVPSHGDIPIMLHG